MDWKKFIVRTAISAFGAVGSYLTSVSMEDFAGKFALWLVFQTLVSSLATLDPEDVFTSGRKKKIHWFRDLLSNF